MARVPMRTSRYFLNMKLNADGLLPRPKEEAQIRLDRAGFEKMVTANRMMPAVDLFIGGFEKLFHFDGRNPLEE